MRFTGNDAAKLAYGSIIGKQRLFGAPQRFISTQRLFVGTPRRFIGTPGRLAGKKLAQMTGTSNLQNVLKDTKKAVQKWQNSSIRKT